MNITEITVSNDFISLSENERELIKKAIDKVIDIEKIKEDVYVSVIVVDKEEIKRINNEHRGIDKETDVLSFPSLEYDEEYNPKNPVTKLDFNPDYNALYLGDIVLCYDVIKSQAEEYGHSIERELSYLTVHSMYHLLGYDHINSVLKADMRKKEEEALKEIL